MRTFGKWLGRILLMLVLAATVVGVWKWEQIKRLHFVVTLFNEGRIVENFSNMDKAFLTVPVPRGDGPVTPLPAGAPLTPTPEMTAWVAEADLTSLLVLHRGEIVHEGYYLGTEADDHRISWSLAKSFMSSLFGILLEEGAIGSIDDPVTQYVPQLAGTAYDGATIRNVLQMTSTVVFDEDYLDQRSDIQRMGRVLALGGLMDDFTASFSETDGTRGERWQYVSLDTHVLGMVIRGATGRPVSELMSEKIIAPLGLEGAPRFISDGAGVAIVLGGILMTTRDYARFGQMIEQDGKWNGQQIVPADWIAESTKASAPTAPGQIGYGYQWWVPVEPREKEFLGRGIYGQYIYIDQERDLVIVTTAADRQFREPGVNLANVEMMRKIADLAQN
ncbi:serine hydrolase domain-containing protein [Aestuariivita boseongensis]|uniref:serine hydrolase domain-containing protein n=1 Tax=Aestuariivita boseongensis TaxID=1470562 RepID=UPI000682B2F7|nr:serine hydrolase [Aestuariivita boseongensis]